LSEEKREKGEGNSGFKRERSLGPLLHRRERGKWGSWPVLARGSRERGWGRSWRVGPDCQREREKKKKKGKRGRGYRRAAGPVRFRAGPVGFQHLFFVLILFSFVFWFALYLLHFDSKLNQTNL
jgi:hypothetical protein